MAIICIYGAASDRINTLFTNNVYELGRKMGKRGHGLIYGAGATGLMGAAARGMTDVGGKIIGVTPHFMHEFEPIYDKCTELIDTKTMAERKETMENGADAFIVVPGGIGTFDEFFQILTLKELGQLGNKPIALFNIGGYYNKLQEMMQYSNGTGFFREKVMSLYKISSSADEILDYIDAELNKEERE